MARQRKKRIQQWGGNPPRIRKKPGTKKWRGGPKNEFKDSFGNPRTRSKRVRQSARKFDRAMRTRRSGVTERRTYGTGSFAVRGGRQR
jgi:hypothetical protein